MEQDLNCPVCCEIFTDPVILNCTHSFCRACLKQCWEAKGSRECPICRVESPPNEPVANRILKNLCDAVLKENVPRASGGPEVLCRKHNEKLKLFCLEDQQPVCVVCRDAKKHENHRIYPIGDIASEYKEEIQPKLHPLREKLTVFGDFKMQCNQILTHIMTQANDTEKQIKMEFEKLHQFLRNEEVERVAALREEEQQKKEIMEKEIEKISREISSLSDTIRAMEDAMGADDITFLEHYKRTVERTQCRTLSTPEDPEKVSGALIDVAKHLGNLKFKVWEKMQCVAEYAPVILDPNTAHPSLIVSENLMSVQHRDQVQQLPDNPERFDEYPSVLGSEGFTSGTHSWDVEVGDQPSWEVGVMLDSAEVKGTDYYGYDTSCWIVCCAYYSEYMARSGNVSLFRRLIDEPFTDLKVKEKPKRIRVELSLNRGRVSFSDPDNNTMLHTFTHKFEGKVFPYFKTESSLRILPMAITVTVEQPK